MSRLGPAHGRKFIYSKTFSEEKSLKHEVVSSCQIIMLKPSLLAQIQKFQIQLKLLCFLTRTLGIVTDQSLHA